SSPSQSGPAGGASAPPAAAPAASGAASATAGQPRRGGTPGVGQDVVPRGVDPHPLPAPPFVSHMVYAHIYRGLLGLHAELQPQADLAERWDTTDYQTFVFHLRRGVKFHHGRDMTADDVVYSLARLADPAKNDRPRSWLRDAAVQATDASTVQV